MNKQGNSTDECVIAALIGAIDTYLAPHQETIPGVGDVLTQIFSHNERGFGKNNSTLPSPQADILKTAIGNIRAQTLKTSVNA